MYQFCMRLVYCCHPRLHKNTYFIFQYLYVFYFWCYCPWKTFVNVPDNIICLKVKRRSNNQVGDADIFSGARSWDSTHRPTIVTRPRTGCCRSFVYFCIGLGGCYCNITLQRTDWGSLKHHGWKTFLFQIKRTMTITAKEIIMKKRRRMRKGRI